MKEFAEILINQQVIYTYEIPEELQTQIAVGQEVELTLRNKKNTGYILKFVPKPEFKTIAIKALVSPTKYFDEKLIQLAEFIAQKYKCLLPTALKTILPK